MLITRSHGPVTEIRMATGFLGRGLYWVSVFYFQGILVDAGPPHTAGELRRWLNRHPLTGVLLTHHHEDHCGGAFALPIRTFAPQASLERLAHPGRTQLARQWVWGRARAVQAAPLPRRMEIAGQTVEAIPTPGHSDDHVALLFPDQGRIFSGDLYVHPRVRYAQGDENVPQAIQSLRKVASLDFAELYCAHAGRVDDPKAALQRKIDFLEDVRGRALELSRQGMGPEAIARQIFGRLGTWQRLTEGWFSEANLIRSLLEDNGG